MSNIAFGVYNDGTIVDTGENQVKILKLISRFFALWSLYETPA